MAGAATKSDTKDTPKKEAQERFLVAYQDSCIVAEAAKASGVTRKTLYRWKESDPEFAARWAEVKRWVLDNLEGIAYKRAEEGSDTLVIFLLKSLDPPRYRDNLSVKHTGTVTHDISTDFDREVKELVEKMRERAAEDREPAANGSS